MSNHLALENSPYLLQHAENPVEWYPWGDEALQKARSEDKPVFLSIGYAACHWCHVMAHESFEDPATARVMNNHFVNIKVDREERPDIDGIYMQAVVAMTGQGGWPMSVFLTPDGVPFYGGTYFPPVRRYNMPSFGEVLDTIARLWRNDRSRLLQSSSQINAHLQQTPVFNQPPGRLSEDTLNQAASNLAQAYDWQNGGWGKAPKFPQPMAIEFLLRKAVRGDVYARDIAAHALGSMAKGGMYDVVGGGFARYSTDDRWCIPHFEKMLYDNAQVSLAYLHGWLVCKEPSFRQICEETLDFVLREMTHPLGGFYSSLDADSEGEEGRFYAWTLDEIRQIVDHDDAEFLTAAYNLTRQGNFDGRNVLQRAMSDDQLSEKFTLPVQRVHQRLLDLHSRLLQKRTDRVRPGTDDKILTSWNGLMLIALAEAARYLDRQDYLVAAQNNARFLLSNLAQDGRLLRSWRNGQAKHNAYLEDHAALILGLLALYQTDPDPYWYEAALRLSDEMQAHFTDPGGGFFDTSDDHETLLVRPKDIQDNATPSGNALAAMALLQLAALEGQGIWHLQAEGMLNAMETGMTRYPTAFAQWLSAADFALGPVIEIALIGDPSHPLTKEFTRRLWEQYRPRFVVAATQAPATTNFPALLRDRSLINNLPTAYVCRDFVCRLPTNSPGEMALQME